MSSARAVSRVREGLRSNHLVRGSLVVLLGSLGAAVAGYAYWTYLARGFGPSVVGEVSALGGAAAVVSLLSSHSVGANLLARMPALGGAAQHALVRAVVVVVGPVALVATAGAGFLLVVFGVAVLRHPFVFALFAVGTAAQSVGATLDMAALALRSSRLAALRNTATAVLRLPVLFGVSVAAGSVGGSVAAVAASSTVSLASVVWLLRVLGRLTNGSERPAPLRTVFRDLGRGAGTQAFVAAGTGLPAQVLPVVVVALAGTYAGGQFGVAWLVGSSCFMVAPMVCSSLLTEGARQTEHLATRVVHASFLIAALLAVPLAAYLLAGERILAVFGDGFGGGGAAVLSLLAMSALPNAALNVSVSVLRAHERLRSAAVSSMLAGAVSLLGASLLVPSLGASGAALGWLVGQALGAVVALAACRFR
jgi:O-antigen/teichoic acid export membrane protein